MSDLGPQEGPNQVKVLLLTRAAAAQIQGGPSLTVHLLLKTYQRSDSKPFTLSAVFCDQVALSCQALSLSLGSSKGEWLSSIKRHIPRSLSSAASLPFFSFKFMIRFERATRAKRAPHFLFHAHDFVAAYVVSRRHRHSFPLVLTVHDKGGWVREALLQNPVFRGTIVDKLMRYIENTAVHRADIVAFPSRGAQALFEDAHPHLLRSKDVRVVHTGIDTREMDSMPQDNGLLTNYGVGPGRETILYVGPLIRDKGADTLIEAIASLPDALRSRLACLMVGRGHLRDELQSLIVQRGLQERFRLLGFLPRQEFLQLMKSATLFVLPSRVAVFDYALLEAGAMGLPIITTAVGGNLEMFDEESALLVPPDDPQALAEAMARLISDEALRQRLGRNAYTRIRSRFSLEAMFNSYAAIYQELAARQVGS